MADTTLAAIQKKIRRLTQSPSQNQLSDDDLNEYINTSVLYDFPAHLRLFALRTTITFYTQPGVDTYETTTADPQHPLYDFKNRYICTHPQAYASGLALFYTQERDIFYGNFPQVVSVVDTGLTGNGTTGPFSGTLTSSSPVQGSVIFTALDTNSTAMTIVDYPLYRPSNLSSPDLGYLGVPNQANVYTSPLGTINYSTGQYSFNFPNNTLTGQSNTVYSEVQYTKPGLPTAMLYFDNQFTLRPMPDKSYPIQLQVDVRPTELLSTTQSPDVNQWWQYIAYLAAKKIFEDRMDLDSVQMIMPEFMKQQALVNRTNIDQQTNERSITIYTQAKNYGWGWYNNSNWPF